MSFEIEDFERDVLARSQTVPVLVDFWAAWCAPCRMLGPVLEKLAASADGQWVLAKVDTDRHQDIAARYGIRGIPNVKLFAGGKVIEEFTGALPEAAVSQWLKRALPNPLAKEVARAETLVKEGRPLEAQALLGGILKKDPTNEHARVVLAGTYLESLPHKAQELVAGIEEHSPFFPAADAIRTFSALTTKLENPGSLPDGQVKPVYMEALHALGRAEYDEALQKFIEVIRGDRYYDEDGARKACVAIFRVLGEEHETSRKFRREFSSALYA